MDTSVIIVLIQHGWLEKNMPVQCTCIHVHEERKIINQTYITCTVHPSLKTYLQIPKISLAEIVW